MKYTNVIIPLVIAVIASGGINNFFLEGQNNYLRVVFKKIPPILENFPISITSKGNTECG